MSQTSRDGVLDLRKIMDSVPVGASMSPCLVENVGFAAAGLEMRQDMFRPMY